MKPVSSLIADLDKEIGEFAGNTPQPDDITVIVAEISEAL
jgi:serine phosphatase RsbU (regulator of sigma subunit)